MLQISQQIGHYRLLRPLGSGGMGEVYLAADLYVERKVAIKVMRTDASLYTSSEEAEEAVRLFKREANAIAMFDHPYILPLFECSEETLNGATFTYLVMPYRPEGSLADWQKRNHAKQLTPQNIAHIVQQAAEALQHAHNHQIIHRDVKPSNFLLRASSERNGPPDLLLADFGVAKLNTTSENNMSTSIRGTATYMAPEQWEDRAVPATDQYALAIMTYELLVGRPPFQGNQGQLMYQHFQVQPQPPSAFNPSISSEIDAVLLQALAKNPAARFASISDFAQAFQRAALTKKEETVALAHSNSIIEKTVPALNSENENLIPVKPSRRRNKVMAIFLSVLALLILIGSMSAFYFMNTSQNSIAQITIIKTVGAHSTQTVRALQTAETIQTAQAVRAQQTALAMQTAQAVQTVQALQTVIASVTPTYGAQRIVLLKDPMSNSDQNNDYNWEISSDSHASCAFSSGAYHVKEAVPGTFYYCTAGAPDFSNIAYQVEMTILRGDQGGIVFRADEGSGNYYYFYITQDGFYKLSLYKNNVRTKILASGPFSAINSGLGRPNLIGIETSGSAISLYVNNQLITSVNDSAYSYGQIGVAAGDSGHPTEIAFNNAEVWGL